jgi:hypothetical protein
MVKLKSIKYRKNNDEWHSIEFVPDNPRSVLVYTEDGGVAEAFFYTMENKWIQYRWNCQVEPIAWREMPCYDS